VIDLAHVCLELGRPILNNVSLQVPEGCLYGLVGPGASGKSVLLKVITGLLSPQAGSVRVFEQEVLGLPEHELFELRRKIGMQFQNNALFDFMTVAQNVAFPLRRLFDLDETEIEDRVSERLAAVGLPGFETRFPSGLSGGQKKRVAVARATIGEAKLVIYDEPAAGLDPVSSQKVFELLRREQQRSGTTVVMVSSDIERLLSVTDRVGMMLAGELVFEGTTAQAKASKHPHVHQFINGLAEGPL
jgi:phospholipid/cholesterol/gamma-HCH transport system ATP-binding protein